MTDLRSQKARRSPEELVRHLREFKLDLKTSVGIWFFSPGGSRFHDRYVPEKTIEERLSMIAGFTKWGVRAVEAHYPFEVNEGNIHLYKQLERATGVKLINAGPFIFYGREYEFGSLSNPMADRREQARKLLIENLRFVKEYDILHCGIWPGIDGYTYPLGTQFNLMWDFFESSVAEAMDAVPGVRVAIEPKPYEPIPNNIYRTSADGLLLARDIESRLADAENRRLLSEGRSLVCLQPEIGHILMGGEDPAYVFSRAAREGRLAHTHWNSQPLGNYDQDLNLGVVGWESAEAALYALKIAGYDQYFGIDINPERIPVETAVEINWRALTILNDFIERLPHERLVECYLDPEHHRGEIELILLEARSRSR